MATQSDRAQLSVGRLTTDTFSYADCLHCHHLPPQETLDLNNTALESALAVFQESKDTCLIIGAEDGEIRVGSYDDIEVVLADASLKKADKLRIWLIPIPLPKIPPILVAAVARHSEDGMDDLHAMHSKLATTKIYTLSHWLPMSLGLVGQILLRIPLYRGRYPYIMVQDSKHALKTGRNQLLTCWPSVHP
ncbi:hypothetical protein CPB83DRAFT_899987 [Crepidotus variabilis]|uniref:Uncharacterized protein n=1 Tax=Crepidotus variabilis TaxID=179855 RepID=A0A9P6E3W9_9AGAR|nr:hypothetical protein CPB83DRAFT_899987 [Crepidotus variabilis]